MSKIFQKANFFLGNSSVDVLQALAAIHRAQFIIPVIGITGSNGKTIIKEWLFQLLSADYNIVKNPGSYNSQIGVPLSVWAIQSHHQLGIFEAGISKPHEMARLQKIIQPTIGIFTNIGTAHDEGFENIELKISEKLKLFDGVETLIYCADHDLIHKAVVERNIPKLSWGRNPQADVKIHQTDYGYQISYKEKSSKLSVPFSDAASIENALHCAVLMLHLDYPFPIIQNRINKKFESLFP